MKTFSVETEATATFDILDLMSCFPSQKPKKSEKIPGQCLLMIGENDKFKVGTWCPVLGYFVDEKDNEISGVSYYLELE